MPINIKKEFEQAITFLEGLPTNSQGARLFDYDTSLTLVGSGSGKKIPQGGFKYICHFEDKKWPANVALAVPKLSDGSAKIKAEAEAMASVVKQQPKYNLIPFQKIEGMTFGCKTDPANTSVAGFLMQWIPDCIDGKPFVAARAKKIAGPKGKLRNNFIDVINTLPDKQVSVVREFFTIIKPVWGTKSIDDFQVLIDKTTGEVYTIDVDKLVGGGDEEELDLVLEHIRTPASTIKVLRLRGG